MKPSSESSETEWEKFLDASFAASRRVWPPASWAIMEPDASRISMVGGISLASAAAWGCPKGTTIPARDSNSAMAKTIALRCFMLLRRFTLLRRSTLPCSVAPLRARPARPVLCSGRVVPADAVPASRGCACWFLARMRWLPSLTLVSKVSKEQPSTPGAFI